MKKKTRILTVIIIVAVALVLGLQLYTMNKQYPQAIVNTIAVKQEEKFIDGIMLSVNDYQWMNREEVELKYGENLVSSEEESFSILVDIRIRNTTNTTICFPLYQIYIEKLGYCNGINAELFMECNPKHPNLQVEIDANKKMDYTLTYTLYKMQFSEKEWETIKNKEFFIAGPRYPVKNCWMIQ